MRRNKAWHECVSGDLFWMGIAVLAAGVLFLMFFRAASMIDPRRADGYDEMILFLASHSFLLIPCAVFVLLGINVAVVRGVQLFLRKAPDDGFAGIWREKADAARGKFRDASRLAAYGKEITPTCPNGVNKKTPFKLRHHLRRG